MSDISSILLPTEYQAALARVQRIEERLLSISVGGGLLALATAAYVLINRTELKVGPAWLAPLAFILTAAVLLGLFTARIAARTQVRALRCQAGMPADPATTPAYPPFLRSLMLLPGLGLALLYLLTVLYALRAVYSVSRAAGTIFGLGYGLLSIVLCLAAVAVWRYWHEKPALTFSTIRQVLLPDPADLLVGIGLFTAGFLAPAATVGLNAAQLGVINALFRRSVDFTDSVPWAAAAALGLCYFAVLEGLLVPAGRCWLKLRQAETNNGGYAQIIIRLLVAFPLAFALGGLPLLVLSLLIWLQQAIAVLNASPTAAPINAASPGPRLIARMRFSLLWDGLRSALRFYGGVLVWVGPAWSFTFLLLLFCAVAFLGVAFRAAQNARRARFLVLRGEETHSAYDLNHAPRWQRAGFLAAGLTALGLTMLQILAETNDYFNSFIAAGYGRFNNSAVQYSQAGLVNGLLLTLDLLLFGMLACVLYVRLLRPAGPILSLGVERVRAWLIPFLLAASLGLAFASALTGLYSLLLGGLLTATLGAAVGCER